MNETILIATINIEKQLGGFADLGDGVIRMSIAQQGKLSDGVQLKQIRTGDLKKIAHHQIGGPNGLELRQ